EHPGGVLDRLLVADLGRDRIEIGHVRALVVGSHLEGAARACRGLLEDQADLLVEEALDLEAATLGGLEAGREVDQVANVIARVVLERQEVAVEKCTRDEACPPSE